MEADVYLPTFVPVAWDILDSIVRRKYRYFKFQRENKNIRY